LDTNFFNDTHDKLSLIQQFSAATQDVMQFLIEGAEDAIGTIEKTLGLVDEFVSYGGLDA
jgi:hypothetical protein